MAGRRHAGVLGGLGLTVRVSVIGGGGFRAPLVYESVASVAPDVGIGEVVLHDVSGERLARIEAVLLGLRGERGGGPAVVTTTSLEEAVDGASFVFCAIRVGGLEARIVDERVPLAFGVLGQETVGPGGIAFALRTVPVIGAIGEFVAARAPLSWFLNFTNPAGLVTEALTETLGDRVVGICDSPTALCARVAAALEHPMRSLSFGYAGINHLGWLVRVVRGGRDLMPGLLADDDRLSTIDEARLFGPERLRKLRMIPNEYLVYVERANEIAASMRNWRSRGEVIAAAEAGFYDGPVRSPPDALAVWRAVKDRRHRTYMAEAWSGKPPELASPATRGPSGAGAPDDEGPGEAGYSAVAASFVRAITGDRPETLILNAPNASRISALVGDAVVEAPCRVADGTIEPLPLAPLPEPERDLVVRMKDVERLTLRAAREGSATLALEAIAAHPVVPSREVARCILDGYLEQHRDLRERLR